MEQKENTFTAIAKTGEGVVSRMGRVWGSGHTAAFTCTIFLHHPFPKSTVSFLSLWPRQCSNMKKKSDKGNMLCRHLGNSGDFFFTFKLFCLLVQIKQHSYSTIPGLHKSPIITTMAPLAREANCPEPQEYCYLGSFGAAPLRDRYSCGMREQG